MSGKYLSVNAYKTMFAEYPDVVSIKEIQKMLGIGREKAYSPSHFKYVIAKK